MGHWICLTVIDGGAGSGGSVTPVEMAHCPTKVLSAGKTITRSSSGRATGRCKSGAHRKRILRLARYPGARRYKMHDEHFEFRSSAQFDRPITMAFQPIVDLENRLIFAHEALVRGKDGAGAHDVLGALTPETRYHFEQICRNTAIRLAAAARIEHLSVNFMPNAIHDPELCVERTHQAAERYDYPLNDLIFELAEHDAIADPPHLRRIMDAFRANGFRTALDDFGAGYAQLNLLTEIQPDILKLDRKLIMDVDRDAARRAIIKGILVTARGLGILIIAEGVERREEALTLLDMGVALQQGYLFARPVLETSVACEDIDFEAVFLEAA
jgi:EAL domain-containing protein (putative c-di-GMP-specific phosphodiesterase class I)